MSATMPCALGRFMHASDEADQIKRAGYVNHRILVVALDDRRLSPAQRTALEQVGDQLYKPKGKR